MASSCRPRKMSSSQEKSPALACCCRRAVEAEVEGRWQPPGAQGRRWVGSVYRSPQGEVQRGEEG